MATTKLLTAPKRVNKGLKFKIDKNVVAPQEAVHVVHHGQVIATIYPSDAAELAIEISSPNFAGPFTKSVEFDARRVPTVILKLKAK